MKRGHEKALAVFERELLRRGLTPDTCASNLSAARRFLADQHKPVRKIARRDVEEHLAALQEVGVASSTQARTLSSLRALCKALVQAGILTVDPTLGLRVERGERSPRLLLSTAQVARLLDASQVQGPGRSLALALRDRALLELLYCLGLRSAEARAARLLDLDLAEGTLLVRRVKGEDARVLPLPPSVLPHVRRYLEEGRPRLVRRGDTLRLFVTKTGLPLRDRGDVHRIVAKIGKHAGIAGCYPHALRRAVASQLVAAGVSVRAVQIFLGHRLLSSTQLYVAVDRKALHRAVALLERTPG